MKTLPADRLPVRNRDGSYSIPLTHGKVAVVDAIDLPKVSGRLWFAHMRKKKPSWYATGYVNGKQIRLHRHILGLAPGDRRQVDHLDGSVANNRRSNLRICDNTRNNQNRQTAIGKVGFKGVAKSRGGRFVAKVQVDGKSIYLGSFCTPEAAAAAYDTAAIEHFGEFAATNASLGLLPPEVSA